MNFFSEQGEREREKRISSPARTNGGGGLGVAARYGRCGDSNSAGLESSRTREERTPAGAWGRGKSRDRPEIDGHGGLGRFRWW